MVRVATCHGQVREIYFFFQGQELMINESPLGKTNNVVFEQARHKPTCTSTEKS